MVQLIVDVLQSVGLIALSIAQYRLARWVYLKK